MSAIVNTVTDIPKTLVSEVKKEVQPATKEGVASQAIGFALGIPVSMFYDWLYDLVSAKVITNAIARDVLKVAMPLGVGVVVQVAKLPFGNIIAGTGYGVALISLFKILYNRFFKGIKGAVAVKTEPVLNDSEITLWGVQ